MRVRVRWGGGGYGRGAGRGGWKICAGAAARTESVITSLRLMSERARLMSTSHFSADGRLTFVRHACIDLVSCIARASASSRFCSAAAEMRSMVA